MTHNEMIAVIQAAAQGKIIEARAKDNDCSRWCEGYISWNFDRCDYRIKPEPPKPREGYVYVSDLWSKPGCIASNWVHVREVLP